MAQHIITYSECEDFIPNDEVSYVNAHDETEVYHVDRFCNMFKGMQRKEDGLSTYV